MQCLRRHLPLSTNAKQTPEWQRECNWVWDHLVESFICGAMVADAVFEMDFAYLTPFSIWQFALHKVLEFSDTRQKMNAKIATL